MKIAVLGAGMLGSCLSLELAQRGLQVDLYDREIACMTQSGQRNEGKIHIGFVYGADPSLKTCDLMLKGAMEFYPLLTRWIGNAIDSICVSSLFIYAVEKTSILSKEQVKNHFEQLQGKLSNYQSSCYPGGLTPQLRELSQEEISKDFSLTKIESAFLTCERAIDIKAVGDILRSKISANENIAFYPLSKIKQVSQEGKETFIEILKDGQSELKGYDIVVNTLWDGRIALDEQVGLKEPNDWSYRIKHAIFLKTTADVNIPSVTLIQGPYGDIVNLGNGRYYFSWYPTCMKGFAKNTLLPPKWNKHLEKEESEALTFEALKKLSEYVPEVAKLNKDNIYDLRVLGGIIYAHGSTDVDDPNCELHNRYKLHIKKKESYYSINPGKYSLCPFFAFEAADQICSHIALSTATV